MSNDRRREVAPPRLARLLFRWISASRNSEYALGDLEEQFQDLVDSAAGLRGARRWYWRQVLESIRNSDTPKRIDKRQEPAATAGVLDSLRQNLRFAIRSIGRAPAFAAAAIVTLALGIGPNTAIFSIVDTVLLRPLQYQNPDRLVALWETNRSEGNAPWRVAPANYKDWRDQADAFEDAAAFSGYSATVTGRGEAFQIRGGRITANYFSVLGVRPILGRAFDTSDESSSTPVVVLGYNFWKSRFGGLETVIGESVLLDGAPRTIIGVMPRGIYPTWPVNGPRIHFQPEYHDAWVLFSPQVMNNRGSHVMGVIARMKPGTTIAGAQKQMDTVARRLESQYPANKDEGALVRPLMDEVTGEVRPALLILLAAVGSVLLIACSNVAGLLLARLTSRRQEIAVRTALGAGRGALLSQFFMEGLLLALAAGMLGTLLATQCHQLLLHIIPQEIPRLADVRLDGRVLAFTIGISFLAAMIFGLVPAWAVSRLNISDTLKETSRGNEGLSSQRLRQTLVIAQVSMAAILTIAAGLLAQSFWRMKQVDPGFRPDHLLVAHLSLPSRYETWQQISNFHRRLLEGSRALPGVMSANITYDNPIESNWLTGFSIEGKPEQDWSVQLGIVSPGYFSGVGHRMVAGREFMQEEDHTRPGVAIVNEAFVRRYLPEGKPLGRILLSTASSYNWKDMPDRFAIVGIVADVLPPGMNTAGEPYFYLSSWQFPIGDMKLMLRTSVEPQAAIAALRRLLNDLDGQLPIVKVTTMDRVLSEAIAQPRLNMVLMLLFGALALTLSMVGIYGLIALWVAARKREIGMRVAMGASPRNIVLLVLQRGGKLILAGVLLGLLGAFALSRFLQAQLFGLSAHDPLTYIAVPLAIIAIGLLACILPALTASRVDPLIALRDE